MNPTQPFDLWIGDSCTGYSFGRHEFKYYHEGEARRALLEELHKNHEKPVWPFVHGLCQVDAPWFAKGTWGLDPLVIPLLSRLNDAGIHTFSSCQGNGRWCPHILFTGTMAEAIFVQSLVCLPKTDSYYDWPIIGLEMARPEQDTREDTYGWNLWFHDTLSLIKWNRDRAHISVEKQVLTSRPPMCSHIPFADPARIEAVL